MCCAVRTLEQPSAKRGIKVELNKTRPTGPKEARVVTAPALTHTTQHTPHYYHHHHHHTATDCSADKGRTDTTHYNNTGALQTTQPSTYRILRAQASCRGGPGPHVFSFKTTASYRYPWSEKLPIDLWLYTVQALWQARHNDAWITTHTHLLCSTLTALSLPCSLGNQTTFHCRTAAARMAQSVPPKMRIMERSDVTGPSQRELGCCVPDREGQGGGGLNGLVSPHRYICAASCTKQARRLEHLIRFH